MTEPGYLTVREAALRLECHENTIRNWCKNGTIQGAWERGTAGFRRIPESEVERLLAERPSEPQEPREYVVRRPMTRPDGIDTSTLQGVLMDAAWKAIEFHGYTQVAVAEAADMSPKHLNQMLHGNGGSFEAWDRLMMVLEIRIGWHL